MATNYSPKIVTDGLVLCLDAANPKSYPGSGTTWKDLSGKGNHATLSNSTYSTWNSIGYFEHRPSDDWELGSNWSIPHSNSLDPNNGFWSVCGWTKVIGNQSSNGVGWFHKEGNPDERGIHLEPITGNFRANASDGWSSINYNIDNSGVWQYFCFTFSQTSGTYGTNPGVIKFYINGSFATQDISFTPVIDSGAPIWLGRRNGHLGHYLKGDISSYHYYTKTLTADEIEQNFQTTRGRYGI